MRTNESLRAGRGRALWLSSLLWLAGVGAAQAVPLSYGFTLGAAGSGSFTVRANADAPAVQVNTTQQELSAFAWNIPGIGSFDLADLSLFSLTSWDPLTGLVPNAGHVSLIFNLKPGAQSDTGASCAVCTVFSSIDWPATDTNGGLGLVRISADGSPCTAPGGLCSPVAPVLTANGGPNLRAFSVAAVPEPSSLALALLAVGGVPLLGRLRRA